MTVFGDLQKYRVSHIEMSKEAGEDSLCNFFENWLMKLKFFNLRNMQNLTCIFLSVRGILKETFQCETPCTSQIKKKLPLCYVTF